MYAVRIFHITVINIFLVVFIIAAVKRKETQVEDRKKDEKTRKFLMVVWRPLRGVTPRCLSGNNHHVLVTWSIAWLPRDPYKGNSAQCIASLL